MDGTPYVCMYASKGARDRNNSDASDSPQTMALKNEEQPLLGNIEEVAAAGFTPCEYLGVETGTCFEKDPAKWPTRDARRSHALVVYEWKYVFRGDGREPHRIRVFANNTRDQGLSQDPLTKSAPTNLFFTAEFMQSFADKRWPGTTYTGISYESDRPEFLLQVPEGGLNIQDTPVYWSLPCRRTVCMSLLEFKDAKDDQLTPGCSTETYTAVHPLFFPSLNMNA